MWPDRRHTGKPRQRRGIAHQLSPKAVEDKNEDRSQQDKRKARPEQDAISAVIVDKVAADGPLHLVAGRPTADHRTGERSFGPVDAGHFEEHRADLLEQRRVLQIGVKDVRFQV